MNPQWIELPVLGPSVFLLLSLAYLAYATSVTVELLFTGRNSKACAKVRAAALWMVVFAAYAISIAYAIEFREYEKSHQTPPVTVSSTN